jgi:hypothetical protein
MNHNPYQPPAAAGFGPQSAVPTGAGDYEFSQYENQVIERLGGRIKWWGMLSIAFGSLAVLGVLGFGLTIGAVASSANGPVGLLFIGGAIVIAIPIVLVYLVTGGLYVGSGKAFKEVVRTQGNDVEHILNALQKMGKAFYIEILMTVLAFGLAIVGVIGLAIFAAGSGEF